MRLRRSRSNGIFLSLVAILVLGVLAPLSGEPSLVARASGNWALDPGLQTPRNNPNATVLPNGKVLVVGGTDANGNFVTTAELFDPVSGTSSFTGSPGFPRDNAVTTLLSTHKVLRAGGLDKSSGAATNVAEVYDPTSGQWSQVAPMSTPRQNARLFNLPDGTVLVYGGEGGTGTSPSLLKAAEVYDPIANTWKTVSNMITPRNSPASIFLAETGANNGELLVFGGLNETSNSSAPLASAELYNPLSQTWTATDSLNTARDQFSANLLPNGKVLVAGGLDANGKLLDSAEVYDPGSGTWSYVSSMNAARANHQSLVLDATGQVLVAGGFSGAVGSAPGSATASAELFSPFTETWTLTGSLTYPRAEFGLQKMAPDGQILAFLGKSARTNAVPIPLVGPSELYNPYSRNWSVNSSLNVPRENAAGVTLLDGRIARLGGEDANGNVLASVEVYQEQYPARTGWTSIANMTTARALQGQVVLSNGLVLDAGGLTGSSAGTATTSAELYNPSPGASIWSPTGAMNYPRADFTLTNLPDGRAIAVGGNGVAGTALSTAEVYDPNSSIWSVKATMLQAQSGHRAIFLSEVGKLLVVGGASTTAAATNFAELYDPVDDSWRGASQMSAARTNPSISLLSTGQVLVAGGTDPNGNPLDSTDLYNPLNQTWKPGPSMNVARANARAIELPGGYVLLVGGLTTGGSATNTTEIFDPATQTWTLGATLPSAVENTEINLLPNGDELIAGGNSGGNLNETPISLGALYHPLTGTITSSTTTAMLVPRDQFRATRLPNGEILAAGGIGTGGVVLSSAEEYESAAPSSPRAYLPLVPNGTNGASSPSRVTRRPVLSRR